MLKWFKAENERNRTEALSLRRSFERGELHVLAPSLLVLEIVNVAGRRWSWDEQALTSLSRALVDLGFEFVEPELDSVARWTARGLTAYDAAYVAIAEEAAVPLVTDDNLILSTAPNIAQLLAERDDAQR